MYGHCEVIRTLRVRVRAYLCVRLLVGLYPPNTRPRAQATCTLACLQPQFTDDDQDVASAKPDLLL